MGMLSLAASLVRFGNRLMPAPGFPFTLPRLIFITHTILASHSAARVRSIFVTTRSGCYNAVVTPIPVVPAPQYRAKTMIPGGRDSAGRKQGLSTWVPAKRLETAPIHVLSLSSKSMPANCIASATIQCDVARQLVHFPITFSLRAVFYTNHHSSYSSNGSILPSTMANVEPCVKLVPIQHPESGTAVGRCLWS